MEKAYLEKYGTEIPKVIEDRIPSDHALWKIHGDILAAEQRWVLPYEPGCVFDSLCSLVGDGVMPAVIIGYREQEPVVIEKLISVSENRGGVTRIQPDLPGAPPSVLNDNALIGMK